MTAPQSRLSGPLRAVRAVAANPDLRCLALAFAGSTVATYGMFVALLVVAFEAGGAAAAGLVAMSVQVPAAALAPIAAVLADRYPRKRALVVGYATQGAALTAAAAALAADGPVLAVYGSAALVSVTITVIQPAQTALLPVVSRTPAELTAASVVVGVMESVGLFAGPAAAGVLLGVSGAAGVFAGLAGLAFGASLLAGRVLARHGRVAVAGTGGQAGAIADLRDGLAATLRDPRPRSIVGILSALAFTRGAGDVLAVVVAFRLLETGGGGTALLNAAYGVGAFASAVGTVLLVGRRRLAPVVLGGAFCWTAALGGIGLAPHRIGTPLLMVVSGMGRPLVEVTGRVLLLRAVPDQLVGRVFGVLEGMTMAGTAAGLLLAPTVIATLGERGALVAVGVVLPVVVGLAWRRLAEIDATAVVPEANLRRLGAVPIFAPLSAPTQERLARRLVPMVAPAGVAFIREGDRGDRFYVIDAGEVDVTVGGQVIDAHGPGGFVGEIALLRDVPRTATVTARTEVRLLAFEREDFLAAVSGHDVVATAAEAVVRERLDDRLARERADRQV